MGIASLLCFDVRVAVIFMLSILTARIIKGILLLKYLIKYEVELLFSIFNSYRPYILKKVCN